MSTVSDSNKKLGSQWRLKTWYPDIDANTHEKFVKYYLELIKFNKTINLISSKTEATADGVHFADCILASRIVREKANKNNDLYDIGSGNGFPGLIYGIMYPDQKVVLIDSDERKCEFLKHVIQLLSLQNVVVNNTKVESLSADSVQQAICRGFAPLPKALLTLRKIVASGGTIYHLKGDEWALEISEIPSQLCSIWRPELVSDYLLPIGDKVKMFVVKTERIS